MHVVNEPAEHAVGGGLVLIFGGVGKIDFLFIFVFADVPNMFLYGVPNSN